MSTPLWTFCKFLNFSTLTITGINSHLNFCNIKDSTPNPHRLGRLWRYTPAIKIKSLVSVLNLRINCSVPTLTLKLNIIMSDRGTWGIIISHKKLSVSANLELKPGILFFGGECLYAREVSYIHFTPNRRFHFYIPCKLTIFIARIHSIAWFIYIEYRKCI